MTCNHEKKADIDAANQSVNNKKHKRKIFNISNEQPKSD